jgi:malonyl-CoA decarboxylase
VSTVNASFFQDLLGSIAERGRALIVRSGGRSLAPGDGKATETLESLSRALLSGRGEASGVALARRLLDGYTAEPMPARIGFFPSARRSLRP